MQEGTLLQTPNKYCIGSLLGRGAFGVVQRATRVDDKKEVAIKFINVPGGRERQSAVEEVWFWSLRYCTLTLLCRPNVGCPLIMKIS